MQDSEEKFHADDTPSTAVVFGDPDDCYERVNKYGTYNIQPTADADNAFPMIAHGLPRAKIAEEEKRAEEKEEKNERHD